MGLRILFAAYTSAPTGPTTSLLLLLEHLREAHDVSVLLRGSGKLAEELERRGIPYHSIPTFDRRSIPAIARLLRQNRTQLLYLNNMGGAMRNAALAAMFARVPYVAHVREMGHDKSWFKIGYLRRASAVIAVSSACAASIQRFVRKTRLHVVHNGVEATSGRSGHADREYTLATCGLPDDAVVILSASHVAPRKGQEYAIRAMGDLVRERPQAHLCLAGGLDRDPAYASRLRALIQDMDLASNVHMIGFRPDMPRLFRGADIFLHTALSDPHPRAVLEAMAAELPVVAFATDGVLETVVEGRTGFIVPQHDHRAVARSLLPLIGDPALRVQIGGAGRRHVIENFSAAGAAARVDEIIGVLSRRRRGRPMASEAESVASTAG